MAVLSGRRGASASVLVVGGGVIGVSIAELLASEGIDVRLVEAGSIASGASGAAAGMLAPVSESGVDSPLLRLGLESLARFPDLCARLREETGIDPELEASGLLRLAFDAAEAERLRESHRSLAGSAGASRWAIDPALEWLEGEALREVGCGVASDVRVGVFSPCEGHLRPPLLVRALEASARARGARIDTGVRVTRLRCDGARVLGVDSSAGPIGADAVVLAAGAFTPELLASAGPEPTLPIEPVRGQILSLEAPPPGLQSIVWTPGLYFVPKRDGSWVVGATQERVGFDRRVTAAGIAELLNGAIRVFPALADASLVRTWAGLRPVSADGLPAVGGVPGWEGLFVAAGHGRNGVLLSPITARILVDLLLGKTAGAEAGGRLDAGRFGPG